MGDVRSIVGSLMETAPAWGLVGRGRYSKAPAPDGIAPALTRPIASRSHARALLGAQAAKPFLNCRPVRFEQSRGRRREGTAQEPSLMRLKGGFRVRGLRWRALSFAGFRSSSFRVL